MRIPIKSEVASDLIGENAVGEILASWSIEAIKQFLNQVEAELRKRRIPHAHRALRQPCPRLMH
jgi:hypothetical protein